MHQQDDPKALVWADARIRSSGFAPEHLTTGERIELAYRLEQSEDRDREEPGDGGRIAVYAA